MTDTRTPSGWTDAQYQSEGMALLSALERRIDAWLDDDTIDIDAARSGNMLTLTLPNRSQLIINLQPPLHEVWLAARSGGFHFRYAGPGHWPDTRTSEDFLSVLSRCATEQAGHPLSF